MYPPRQAWMNRFMVFAWNTFSKPSGESWPQTCPPLPTLSQRDYNRAVSIIEAALETDIPSNAGHSAGFITPSGGGKFGAGVLSFSPGWFMQAQEASVDNSVVSKHLTLLRGLLISCMLQLACSRGTPLHFCSQLHMPRSCAMQQ